MATEKKYYWLKLQNDFFSSKRIKKLRKLGSDFVIIYLKMQLLSLQNNGVLEYSGIEDSFAEEIALDIDEDTDKVQLTISYLQSCGLLEVTDENDFFLPYVEKCTGVSASDEHTRESTRQRVARFRERQKQLALENVTETLQKRYGNVTCNGEIEKEIEIEKDKEIDKKEKIIKEKFGEFQNVRLTDKEYDKLANDFGVAVRDKAIKFLDEYIEEKGYKSKSHNLAIRRWVIDAVNKNKAKSEVIDWSAI